jgi:hypothetical protein
LLSSAWSIWQVTLSAPFAGASASAASGVRIDGHFEREPIGVVNDAIEDGVGESRLTEHRRILQFLIGP